MGGPSGPTLLCPIAAIRPKSLGPEGPPTKASGLKDSPRRRAYSPSPTAPSPAWNASPSASAAACTTGITRSYAIRVGPITPSTPSTRPPAP
ncbi:DUF6053 domain-containing protein [Lysobacter yananisis]|uniref:DUF6053 domain-containing protein n=1 Tax=Lysobacter yananisis TaxID=1003114 RepID=UPI003CE59E2E